MTAKTDLTFAELNEALGGNAMSYNGATDDIMISVKAITDNAYNDLTDEGVN